MKKYIYFLAIILSLSCNSNSNAQKGDSYNSTLKKFLLASGAQSSYQSVLDQMMGVIDKNNDKSKAVELKTFKDGLKANSLNDLIDKLAPVYEKHLSQEDLNELITFYESPLGKKLISKQAIIANESMPISKDWGFKLGQQFKAITSDSK